MRTTPMPRWLLHTLCCLATTLGTPSIHAGTLDTALVTHRDGLVAFWDFSEPTGDRVSIVGGHRLREVGGEISRVAGGPFSGYAARLSNQRYFSIPRVDVVGTPLDIHGPDAQVSVVAWVKRSRKTINPAQLEFLGGLWNEDGLRQYGLFINDNNSGKVTGHISDVGVGTPGGEFNRTRAKGATTVPFDEWVTLGLTYDGDLIRVFYNGSLDESSENPLKHPGGAFAGPGGIFDGGANGSDFTFGAVYAKGGLPSFVMRNFFEGEVGGLAVFNRALAPHEMLELHRGRVPEPGTAAIIVAGAGLAMLRRSGRGAVTAE